MTSNVQDTVSILNDNVQQARGTDERLTAMLGMVCEKKHIFDMVQALSGSLHIDTVRTLADKYASNADPWGWVWLCSGVPARNIDPIEWMPKASDYAYLSVMLAFLRVVRLPASGLRDMVEFPLRLAVDRLLMSGAFHGCGVDMMKKWRATPSMTHCCPVVAVPAQRNIQLWVVHGPLSKGLPSVSINSAYRGCL